jgi:hypothetical protein
MDFPQAHTPATTAQWRRMGWVMAVVALAIYAEFLSIHIGAVSGGSDSSGYMNHAKLIAGGAVNVQPRTIAGLPAVVTSPYLYIPLGFRPSWNSSAMVPTYPMGLSLFIVASKALVGWRHAGDVTMMLHALAGVVATFALGRTFGLSRPWSVLCAATIALSPLYLFMSLTAMSDVPSLVWTALAILAAIRGRERPSWALAAGAALAVDVLLRPANVLALIPLGLALGASPRRWTFLLLGGLPGATALLISNHQAFGGFLATGYGDNIDAFKASFVPATFLQYLRWFPVLFTPVVVLVLGLPFIPTEKAGTKPILVTWIAVFAVFYATYQFTHESWWYLRFLLPAAPAFVVGSALVLRKLLASVRASAAWPSSPVAYVVAIGFICANSTWWSHDLGVLHIGEDELRYGILGDWMKANLPADAVCLSMQASGSVYFYTPFTILRWDMLNKADISVVEAALVNSRRPLYAVLFPFEVTRMASLERLMPGLWSPVGKVDDVVILRHDLAGAAH